jgi:hypothetical protein
MKNDKSVLSTATSEPRCWTTQSPKQMGYYWHRRGRRHRAAIVYITQLDSGHLAVMDIGDSGVELLDRYQGEWWGPLLAPGEEPAAAADLLETWPYGSPAGN